MKAGAAQVAWSRLTQLKNPETSCVSSPCAGSAAASCPQAWPLGLLESHRSQHVARNELPQSRIKFQLSVWQRDRHLLREHGGRGGRGGRALLAVLLCLCPCPAAAMMASLRAKPRQRHPSSFCQSGAWPTRGPTAVTTRVKRPLVRVPSTIGPLSSLRMLNTPRVIGGQPSGQVV